MEKAIAGSESYHRMNRIVRADDGAVRHTAVHGSPVRSADGHVMEFVGTVQDITERVLAESQRDATLEALRESEEHYRSLFESVPVGLYRTTPDGQILDVNSVMLEMLGFPDRDTGLAANAASAYANPKDRVRWQAMMDREGLVRDFQAQWRRRDGTSFWVKDTARAVADGEGRVLHYEGSLEDITEGKRADNLIRAQRDLGLALATALGLDETLRLCLEAAIHVSEMDCGGIYLVDETSGACDIVSHQGLPPDFIKSASHFDGDSDQARLVTAGEPIYTEHLSLGVELDEAERRESLRAHAVVPVRHEDRVVACLNVASHNRYEVPPHARDAIEAITAQIGSAIARERAESQRDATLEALRETRDYLDNLINHANAPIIIWDPGERITRFNTAFEHLTGYPADEVIGQELPMLFPETSRAESLGKIARTLGGEYWKSVEIPILCQDGETRLVLWNSANIYAEDGTTLVATISQGTDITERRQREQQVARLAKFPSENPNPVLRIARDGTILYANEAGLPLLDLWGCQIGQLLPDGWSGLNIDVLTSGVTREIEIKCGDRTLTLIFAPVVEEDYLNVYGLDTTERKKAEAALRRSLEETARGQRLLLALSQAAQTVQRARTAEEVYRTVGDEVVKLGYHAFVFALTHDQQYLTLRHLTIKPTLLRAAEKLTGLSLQTFRVPLVESPVFQRVLTEGETSFDEPAADFMAGGLPKRVRSLAPRMAAKLGLEQCITAPLTVSGERIGLLLVAGAGLTEADAPAITTFANQASIALGNARLVEEARTHTTDLEKLSIRLFKAQEEERRRISLELHDELGQALTAMGFDLAAIERELPAEVAPKARERLANVGSLLAEVDERVSQMALDLRPQMLDDLGLLPTLRWYLNRYIKRMGIDVELEAVDFEERVTPDVATAVYRTVQEALTNVAKHAGASRVAVRLERSESTVTAVVQDNGRGFEAEEHTAHLRERGAGLLGIQERVALLGGSFDIQSRPGQGTRLTMRIPI